MTSLLRTEAIEDLNDELNHLSYIQCQNIVRRCSLPDIIELVIAIKKAKQNEREEAIAEYVADLEDSRAGRP